MGISEVLMSAAKEIALISLFTALLIGGQFVLYGISGVEVVTVLLLSFSFYFGIRRSVISATAFSILRCFLFGFFVNVLILYLIYYNLFALLFGALGLKFKHELTAKRHIILILAAVFMTALFTLLDDIITPLYYRFDIAAAKSYFILSFTAFVPQTVCSFVTVLLLLPVLIKAYCLICPYGKNRLMK